MPSDFSIKRNDTAPPLGPFVLRDSAGAPVNLTGVTAVALTVKLVGGAVKFTKPVEVLSATGGQCQYVWALDGTDTNAAGEYEWQIQVTYASGRKQTFPTLGSMTLTIDPDADAA